MRPPDAEASAFVFVPSPALLALQSQVSPIAARGCNVGKEMHPHDRSFTGSHLSASCYADAQLIQEATSMQYHNTTKSGCVFCTLSEQSIAAKLLRNKLDKVRVPLTGVSLA